MPKASFRRKRTRCPESRRNRPRTALAALEKFGMFVTKLQFT
jgi:hypothetical protein